MKLKLTLLTLVLSALVTPVFAQYTAADFAGETPVAAAPAGVPNAAPFALAAPAAISPVATTATESHSQSHSIIGSVAGWVVSPVTNAFADAKAVVTSATGYVSKMLDKSAEPASKP